MTSLGDLSTQYPGNNFWVSPENYQVQYFRLLIKNNLPEIYWIQQ